MKKEKKSYLIDMDGVLVHGSVPIPGAAEFIQKLIEEKRKFLILTNNPLYTTRDLGVVAFLLDEFGVHYIVVGDPEREQYGTVGLSKFDELPVAFANDRVTIYRWQPAAP